MDEQDYSRLIEDEESEDEESEDDGVGITLPNNTSNFSPISPDIFMDNQLGCSDFDRIIPDGKQQKNIVESERHSPSIVRVPSPEPDDLSHLIEQEGAEPATQAEIEAGLAKVVQQIKTAVFLKLARTLAGEHILLAELKKMKMADVDKHDAQITENIMTRGIIKAELLLHRALAEQLLKENISDYGFAIKKQGIDPVQYFEENFKNSFFILGLPVTSMKTVAPTLESYFGRRKISKKNLLLIEPKKMCN